MAEAAPEHDDPNARPFTTFNFLVEISVEGVSEKICAAAFSECDGLEISIEPKTIREGGRNTGPVHLMGAIGYGQLSLKRGMTANTDLWRWFERLATLDQGGLRGSAEIVLLSSERQPLARYVLTGCLPTKLKAPSLNAREGQVAIEELQIAYESLTLRPPDGSAAPASR